METLHKIFAGVVLTTIVIPANIAFAFSGIELPSVDLPSVELPGVALPTVDLPEVETPAVELPSVELPSVDLPAVELPSVDLPAVELPSVNLPTVDLPSVELPSVELPSVDLPSVELPTVELPTTEAFTTKCILTANTYEVEYGGSVILTWETEGFDTIKVNGTVVDAADGTITISNITDNTSYTLEATNDNGDSCVTDVDISCNAPVIIGECELKVRKTADKSVVEVGDIVTYTLQVENTGDANCTGTGVWIEDILSDDHQFVSYELSNNVLPGYHPRSVYSTYSHRLSFNGQTLTPGEVAEMTIVTEILPRENLQCGADYTVTNKARASALELNEFNSWKWGSSKVTVDNSCPEVLGCMDVDAKNYDADANTSDNSCVYPVEGCTDVLATNYNVEAEVNDNSCVYPISGCTDAAAKNYNADATVADSNSCIYPVLGCTDVAATNYSSVADEDDNSCVYPEPVHGCTDATATNYNVEADTDDNSCVYPAAAATCKLYPSVTTIAAGDSTELTWETTNATRVVLSGEAGEVDSVNGSIIVTPAQTYMYDLTAYNADGATVSCATEIVVEEEEEEVEVIEGCTDSSALNYNANATVNNNACEYEEEEEEVVTSSGGGGGSSSPRCELYVSDASINAGDTVDLEWDTRNATDITITDDNDTVIVTTTDLLSTDKRDLLDGTIAVAPTETTTYTLVSERGSRDDECEVVVEVENDIVVLTTIEAAPVVAGIALSEVPHTGVGNTVVFYGFYGLMIFWAGVLSYIFVARRKQVVPVTVAANPFKPSAIESMERAVAVRPDLFPRY